MTAWSSVTWPATFGRAGLESHTATAAGCTLSVSRPRTDLPQTDGWTVAFLGQGWPLPASLAAADAQEEARRLAAWFAKRLHDDLAAGSEFSRLAAARAAVERLNALPDGRRCPDVRAVYLVDFAAVPTYLVVAGPPEQGRSPLGIPVGQYGFDDGDGFRVYYATDGDLAAIRDGYLSLPDGHALGRPVPAEATP